MEKNIFVTTESKGKDLVQLPQKEKLGSIKIRLVNNKVESLLLEGENRTCVTFAFNYLTSFPLLLLFKYPLYECCLKSKQESLCCYPLWRKLCTNMK